MNSLIMNFCKLFIMMNYLLYMFIDNMILKWMIVEISTIVFIMMLNLSVINKMVSTYYYMISSISSIFMALMILFYYSNLFNLNYFINILIQFFYMIKLGIMPFSMWMIICFNKLNWNEIFYFSTVMKFLPIMLLMDLINLNYYFFLLLMLNMLLIPIYSFKFNSMKKILACSSINQTSFFIMLSFLNKMIFFYYTIFYLFLMMMLIWIFKIFNISNKKDLMKIYNNKYIYFIYLILILMYACLPPFTSSMMKWMFILKISNYNNEFLKFIMIISLSLLIMIWNYFNFFSYSFFKMEKKINFNKLIYKNKYMLFISFNIYMIILFNMF